MKVVFDTNVFISAVLFGGNPETVFDLAKREKSVTLFISEGIIQETARILKIKFDISDWHINRVLNNIRNNSTLVIPTISVSKITTHNEDNRILECALTAQADYLISGDKKHILSLKKFRGITILSPAEFLKIFFDKR